MYMHEIPGGLWIMLLAVLGLAYTLVHWWRDVEKEAAPGITPMWVQGPAHRHGAVHHLGGDVLLCVLLGVLLGGPVSGTVEGYTWLPAGTHVDAWDIPFLNTLILLLSGCTVTWAHHCVREGEQPRPRPRLWRSPRLLGILFTSLQAYEYIHATAVRASRSPRDLRLDLLYGDGLPRLSCHDRHDVPDRVHVPRVLQPIPRPDKHCRPRGRPPGTGTSSTWSGCSCSPGSTGGGGHIARRRRALSEVAANRPSALSAGLKSAAPRAARGHCSRASCRAMRVVRSAPSICPPRTAATGPWRSSCSSWARSWSPSRCSSKFPYSPPVWLHLLWLPLIMVLVLALMRPFKAVDRVAIQAPPARLRRTSLVRQGTVRLRAAAALQRLTCSHGVASRGGPTPPGTPAARWRGLRAARGARSSRATRSASFAPLPAAPLKQISNSNTIASTWATANPPIPPPPPPPHPPFRPWPITATKIAIRYQEDDPDSSVVLTGFNSRGSLVHTGMGVGDRPLLWLWRGRWIPGPGAARRRHFSTLTSIGQDRASSRFPQTR